MARPVIEALNLAVRNAESRLYHAAPFGACYGQPERASLVTELKRYRIGFECAVAQSLGHLPIYEECGCCGHLHRPAFRGDCRDDSERFTNAEIEAFHGPDGVVINELAESE